MNHREYEAREEDVETNEQTTKELVQHCGFPRGPIVTPMLTQYEHHVVEFEKEMHILIN